MAFLGYKAVNDRGTLEALRAEVNRMQADVSRQERDHNRTRQLLDENARRAVLARELFVLAGTGEQLARGLRGIDRTLPEAFWMTKLISAEMADAELGLAQEDPRPVLRVQGRALEGTSQVPDVLDRFYEAFVAFLPAEARLKKRLSNDDRSFTLDLCLLAPAPAAGEGEADLDERQGG